jgi:ribosomal-protein-alanine N-acetyltransferase
LREELMSMQNQNSAPFPLLTTDRLILRKLEIDDADELLKLRSDESVNKYLDRPKSKTINEVIEFINKIETGLSKSESFYWVISLKDDSKLIGAICLWNLDKENSCAEIGYELLPAYQGKGLMHEALSKIIEYSFQTLGFKTMTAYTDSSNERSVRILEKNNFRRDKALEDEYYKKEGVGNEVIYSLKYTA